MMGFGSVPLTRDLMNAVNQSVRNYLNSIEGQKMIQRQVDTEINRKLSNTNTTKAKMVNKADATYGSQYLLGHTKVNTNDSLLEQMKNKINYGVNPDTVSKNNGSYNYVSY